MREIRKYSNRKYYDTQTSEYVNLTEIRDLVLAGEPVYVRRNGVDITQETLARILMDELRLTFAEQPVPNLVHLIKERSNEINRRAASNS